MATSGCFPRCAARTRRPPFEVAGLVVWHLEGWRDRRGRHAAQSVFRHSTASTAQIDADHTVSQPKSASTARSAVNRTPFRLISGSGLRAVSRLSQAVDAVRMPDSTAIWPGKMDA